MGYKNTALLLVDLQNDFCPGGNLAVPDGNEVIAIANQLMPKFTHVIATQDWHPVGHGSFAETHENQQVGNLIELEGIQQILWPVHCVQGTAGAEFHSDLNLNGIHEIFHKGAHKTLDSYSAFFDNDHRHSTGLAEYLMGQNIQSLYIMGLATDYCVKYTILDALKTGFKVYLIVDGCRGVELHEGDIKAAINEMEKAGANVVFSGEI
jgi:nicotinamidase/pyrazinamidase